MNPMRILLAGKRIYRSPEVAPLGEEPGRSAVTNPPLEVYEVDGAVDKVGTPAYSLCGHSQSVDAEGERTCKSKLMEIERVSEQLVAKPGD